MRAFRTLALITALLAVPAGARAQAHAYHFNGTLADQFGGPSLVADGGLLTSSGYFFHSNQGLSLSNVFQTNQSYSLVIHSRFDGTLGALGWQKMVDFWDLASDHGLYSYFGSSDFDPYTLTVALDYPPGVMATTVITRDAATLALGIFVNGVRRYTITDGGQYGDFITGTARFFEDDTVTNQQEAGSGFVDYIGTYDSALSDQEVATISQTFATPEPGSFLLLATGLCVAATLRRRRRPS